MSKPGVLLTRAQLKELQWFCKNITGTREEFYKHLDDMRSYQVKIDRLYAQAKQISKYLRDLGEDHDISPFKSILDEEIIDKTPNRAL